MKKGAIDLDTRYRAVVHYDRFYRSLRGVAKIYNVSKSSVQRWVTKGAIPIKKHRTKKEIGIEIKQCIDSCLQSNPMLSPQQLCSKIKQSCSVNPSVNTVGRWLKRLDYTRKKIKRTVACKVDDKVVDAFCNSYKSTLEDDIICIDEAGFYVGDHNRYGYSKRGTNIKVSTASTLRRSRFTLVMAIGQSGIIHYEILPKSCKKLDFVDFIQRLPACANGKTLVMDNLNSHHSKETIDAIERRGCKALFVPPYSPRYNAIEYAFSVQKRVYRTECTSLLDDATVDKSEFQFVSMLIFILDTREWDFHPFFDRVRKTVYAYEPGMEFQRYD